MDKRPKIFLKLTLFIVCHLFVIFTTYSLSAQTNCMLNIQFEQDNNHTATYTELISFFHNAGQCDDYVKFTTFGESDAGKPLSVFIIDKKKKFIPIEKDDKRAVVLINNGIHPGEPCGIEASMLLVRDILETNKLADVLDDVVVLIVPIYNIGGMLNRNSTTRVNQEGPAEYGFRGNAKNLDLNRDFIKADSRNTISIHKLFSRWKPDLFIDTHTSNGADYSYTMTLIANMKNRMAPPLADFVYRTMLPNLYDGMSKSGWEMTPYVNAPTTPDEGIVIFDDLPRYSMGFGALHHIPSLTSEAHMLKPYKDRVASTYQLLELSIKFAANHKKEMKKARAAASTYYSKLKKIPLTWKLNKTKHESFSFKGYTAKKKPSEISGHDRLYYDRDEPFEKEIPLWSSYDVALAVDVPHTYVIPQCYPDLIENLRRNGVRAIRCRRDSMVNSKSYRIKSYETQSRPYEGHYPHHSVELIMQEQAFDVHVGDYFVKTDQDSRRFVVETLEPQGPDSYFAWNYFDAILMRKEYFSPYVFEEVAAALLREDVSLQKRFEEKKANDEKFGKDGHAQLEFIYENSPHYEKTHNLYPIGRLFD